MTIKKLKSIDIINVLSDLVSEKLETTVKLPALTVGYYTLAKRNISGVHMVRNVVNRVIVQDKRKVAEEIIEHCWKNDFKNIIL